MQLFFPFILLVGPYLILTLIQKSNPAITFSESRKTRIGLSLFFIFTAMGHFIKTAEMAEMLPPFFIYGQEIIFLTGFPELFGAFGVWIPKWRKLAGSLLIAMLLGFLPFNIYAAINNLPFGGHEVGPTYLLVRVPFQFFVIWWVYVATELDWFKFRKE